MLRKTMVRLTTAHRALSCFSTLKFYRSSSFWGYSKGLIPRPTANPVEHCLIYILLGSTVPESDEAVASICVGGMGWPVRISYADESMYPHPTRQMEFQGEVQRNLQRESDGKRPRS
jgi:hypothetical protein